MPCPDTDASVRRTCNVLITDRFHGPVRFAPRQAGEGDAPGFLWSRADPGPSGLIRHNASVEGIGRQDALHRAATGPMQDRRSRSARRSCFADRCHARRRPWSGGRCGASKPEFQSPNRAKSREPELCTRSGSRSAMSGGQVPRPMSTVVTSVTCRNRGWGLSHRSRSARPTLSFNATTSGRRRP